MNRQESGRAAFLRNVARAGFGDDISAYQRFIRSKATRDSCVENGRKGAAATARLYGFDFLHKKWRAWKLDPKNQTGPEKRVGEILDGLGIGYEREFEPIPGQLFSVDFRLKRFHKKLIEVDGRPHQLPELNDGNPNGRADKDAKRMETLRAEGYKILVIDQAELANSDTVSNKIKDFTCQGHSSQNY